MVSFDIIKNGVSERTIKQYNQIDYDEIKKICTAKYQDQILSSIFRTDRKDMVIDKKKPLMNILKNRQKVMDVVNY